MSGLIFLVLFTFLLVNTSLVAQVIYPEIVDTSEINKEEELKEVINKDSELNQKTDILFQHDGSQAFVNVKRIYLNDLYYTLPGEKKVNKIITFFIEHTSFLVIKDLAGVFPKQDPPPALKTLARLSLFKKICLYSIGYDYRHYKHPSGS